MLVSIARALHKLDDSPPYAGAASLAEIDIDGLSEDDLIALNTRIVERLQILHQQKTAVALQEIK